MRDLGVSIYSKTHLRDLIDQHLQQRSDRAILSMSDVDAPLTVWMDIGMSRPLLALVFATTIDDFVVLSIIILLVAIVAVEISNTETIVEVVVMIVRAILHKLADLRSNIQRRCQEKEELPPLLAVAYVSPWACWGPELQASFVSVSQEVLICLTRRFYEPYVA